ncbi:hypothetical protein LCGC14_2861020 [marine sediment metagenome]|uniref:Uncharacterized protein n=1 Tax=marine sediment metagenome TaxID=412755 RepID=A0A0F9ADY3_9ZZZZ
MKRTKILPGASWPITYNYFEPGTYVVPTSHCCALTHVYEGPLLFKVTVCREPTFVGDFCLVSVEGREDEEEVDATWLREAHPVEIDAGDRIGRLY